MKQKFICPKCGATIYFQLTSLPGALLAKSVNTISIRDTSATVKLSKNLPDEEAIHIQFQNGEPAVLSKNKITEATAWLTCVNDHTLQYTITIE